MKLQDLHFKMLVKTRLDNTFCFVVYSVYIPLAKYYYIFELLYFCYLSFQFLLVI